MEIIDTELFLESPAEVSEPAGQDGHLLAQLPQGSDQPFRSFSQWNPLPNVLQPALF